MEILIGIPVLDNLAMTRVCLESLVAHTPCTPGDITAALVVVDNGSSDDIAGLLRRELDGTAMPVHYVRNPVNRGVAAAWNQILRLAGQQPRTAASPHPWAVIANNDVVFGPEWLEPLAAAMAQNERVGWVAAMENGSPVAPMLIEAHAVSRRHRLDPRQTPSAEAIRRSIARTYAGWGGHAAFCRTVKSLGLPLFIPFRGADRSAVCFLINTAMVEEIGFFDEAYAPVGIAEDLEYYLRMQGVLPAPGATAAGDSPGPVWRAGFCGQSVIHHCWCSTRQGPHFDGRRWDKERERNWRAAFGRSRKHFSRLLK